MLKPAIVAGIICCSLAACASMNNKDAKPQLRDDNEYVTGSNIPKRNTSMPNEVRTISGEELQRSGLPAPQPIPGAR